MICEQDWHAVEETSHQQHRKDKEVLQSSVSYNLNLLTVTELFKHSTFYAVLYHWRSVGSTFLNH